jgi:RecA-family ATPase
LLPTTPKREEISFTQHQAPVLEKEWEYRNEDGDTLFTKRRYKTQDAKGKTYSIHRVDAQGKRIAGLKDTRIVPYQLPELLDAKTAGRAIYLVEGEKAADALVSIGAIATTSHTGAGSWPEEITQYFAGANIVVIPDNDEPGRRYAKRAISRLLPVVKSIRYLDLDLMVEGDDAYEWVHHAKGTRKELAEMAKKAPVITQQVPVTDSEQSIETTQSESEAYNPTPQLLNIEAWDTIKDEPVRWIIENVLPEKGFSALYGPPGSYKSFIALDIAEAVATGRQWMGNQVTNPGAVLYIAGEGHGGIGARIKACKINHQTQDGAEIYVIRYQLNLRSSADDFNLLMQSIDDLIERTGIELRLVQIDTLARAFGGGNENDSQDMGAFIHNVGRLQRKLDCALMVLHHSGKDATKGLRGHSSLLGAVDTQLELQKLVTDDLKEGIAGQGTLTISKQKDGQDNLKFGFEMVQININQGKESGLGLDENVSLAVKEHQEMIDEQHKKTKVPPVRTGRGGIQMLVLDALHKAIGEHGEMRLIDKKRNKSIHVEQWREAFEAAQMDKKGITKRFNRCVQSLQNAKKVEVFDPFVWVIWSDGDQNDSDF